MNDQIKVQQPQKKVKLFSALKKCINDLKYSACPQKISKQKSYMNNVPETAAND